MPDNDRHVEISLGLNLDALKQGLGESRTILQDGLRQLDNLQADSDLGSFLPLQGAGSGMGATPPPNFFEGITAPPPPVGAVGPSMPNPQPDGARLDELNQRLNIIQQMAQSAPDIARANLQRLETQTLNASLKEPESAQQYQELIDAIRQLTGTVSEDSRKKDSSNEFLQWLRANAGMQLGGQVMGNLQQGRFFSAVGGGLGGLIGMLGGPGGMAFGSAIGTSIGGFVEGLATGAQGARAYEASSTDIAGRFGDFGQLDFLRDYNIGGRFGFRAEESLATYDRLRQSRVIGNAEDGAPLVGALQELTRVLGLNIDATTQLYSSYISTGGRRGEGALRDYFADIVGGAIESGFESNLDQYAEIMNSARSQIVQQSGQGVSDRAFDMLQDVFTNLTGTDSATAELFRRNPQMAQGALGTYMAMGGTTDVYGLGAGLLRLAGVQEGQIDRRFTSADQQAANAGRALDWMNDRMIEMSGMSREEFQRRAAADPNFVQGQFQQNVGLQRQVGDFLLPGLLGREASAQDIRAFEQLANVAAANGGQLPGGGEPGSARVNELLNQLSQTPADAARQAEAERHNKQMEVMSHFGELMTRTDQWMADIYGWISENVNLDAIEDGILQMMDWVEDGVANVVEMSESVIQWAEDNNIIGKISGAIEEITSIIQTAADIITDPGGTAAAVGRGVGGVAARAGRGFLNLLIPVADDAFNDTPPGGVVATESYNTFRFAAGDIVQARRGAPPEFARRESTTTLDDINLRLTDFLGIHVNQHKESTEAADLLQETQDASLELTELLQKDSEQQTGKLFPGMLENQQSLIDEVKEGNAILNIINENLPILGQLINDVKDAIGSINSVMGGSMTGGGGLTGAIVNEITQRYVTTLPHLQDYGVARDGGRRQHAGVDFDISGADATAVSFLGGRITRVGNDPGGYGNYVDVFNEALGVVERIAEAEELLVKLGDTISPGQAIGRGESSTGVIHYEIRQDVNAQGQGGFGFSGTTNPIEYLSGIGIDPYAAPDQVFANAQRSQLGLSSGGGQAPAGLSARGQENYQLLQDPRVRAFLATIRHGEGTYGEAGYRTLFGGGTFNDMSRHPDRVISAGGYHSSAAGAYQFLTSTWDGVSDELGLSSFDPLSQDIAAIELLRDRGALDEVLAEDLISAWDIVAPEWASMPTRAGQSYHGQPVKSHDELLRIYQRARSGGGPQFSTGPSNAATQFSGDASTSPVPEFRQYQPSNNIQANINVTVNGAGGDREGTRQAALEGTQAAVDEFERRWRQDNNPRNDEFRNPIFA